MATVLTVVLAFGVGISLGLLGGGGSVLTVPLLVYVAGWSAHEAAAGSLFVVGVTSLLGLVTHARAGRVQWRSGLTLGLAGMAGAFTGGRLSALVPGTVLLLAFAALMLVAGAGMLRSRGHGSRAPVRLHLARAIGLGLVIGVTTGFVGAGGGFVVVPALVLVAGLPMPTAVGTSLLVITLQSAAGLAGHLTDSRPPIGVTLAVTASAVAGSVVGSRLTSRIAAQHLRRGFGVLVLSVAGVVLAAQLPPTAWAASWPWLMVVAAAVVTARTLNDLNDSHRQETSMTATAPDSTMVFTQYYVDCLSQASYLIADTSTGQAVIVDPRRDIQEYLTDAQAQGLRIVGVINTHFHADFLSGHLELAHATGAWIGYGQVADTEFASRSLADGERIPLGNVVLQILQTPGHTPESISVLVYERAEDEVAYAVLTGDALFIGDVGRPDLLASIGHSADQLGAMLYDSVQHRLMALPDAVRVFPAHGAGSACGKNLSTERQSTIGRQREVNYACRPMSEAEFVALVTADQPAAPEYFVYDAVLNRKQRAVFDPAQPLVALDVAGLDAAIAAGAVVLDTRDAAQFAAGHLPGALNVPVDGRFAETAGMVLTADQSLVVLAPDDRHHEVAVRLARIGFDRVIGYVADVEAALLAHRATVQHASRLTAPQLAAALADGSTHPVVVDVRNLGERAGGFVPGSVHIPLAELRRRVGELPTDRPIVTYCAGGWRSSVAASVLRHHGRHDVSDLLGGFGAWSAMNEPVSA